MPMTKSVKKYKGKVDFPYDQSEDERIAGDELLSEGACLGLCIQWIIYRKKDRTGIKFWEWMVGAKTFAGTVVKYAMVKQGTIISLAKSSSGSVREMLTKDKVLIAKDQLAKHGIYKASRSGGQDGFMLKGYSTAVVGNSFIAQPGACCLLFMMGSGGGHVVAFYCGVGEYTFFDPNCGEIRFKDYINFLLWLDDFWNTDSGYKSDFQTFIFMYFRI